MADELTPQDRELLQAVAGHGGPCIPKDDGLKDSCRALVKRKLLKPRPYIDGKAAVGTAAVGIAFEITAEGRKAISACR